jgi:predicted Zn finger-like uncharacterized protein
MPIVIHCPQCQRRLRVPEDLLGKTVRCPSCQTAFTAAEEGMTTRPSAAPSSGERLPRRRQAVPEEDNEERPSQRDRRRPVEDDEDEPRGAYEEDYEEDEYRPRRRRRGRRSRLRAEARSSVAGPAISLMIVGGLTIALGIVSLLLNVLGVSLLAAAGDGPQKPADNADLAVNAVSGVMGALFGICWGGVILGGAYKMNSLQGYGYAMTACILAMLPCNICCVLGLPFGIWGLVVLNREEVKRAFS